MSGRACGNGRNLGGMKDETESDDRFDDSNSVGGAGRMRSAGRAAGNPAAAGADPTAARTAPAAAG